MDCEKFETLLIDELYEELDEVTSAAVRRHAAGCARCGALLSGLRATRKVAALPVEEPSNDLEDRILSAVREQQKVLPMRARASSVLSRAGAWAMRPQTAMAAVFLLVIGTSFVLVQSRKSMSPAQSADFRVVNGEGAPSPVAAAATAMPNASAFALDGKESAYAHGVAEDGPLAKQRVATLTPALENEKDKAPMDEETRRAPGNIRADDLASNAAPIGGALGHANTNLTGGGGGSAPLQQQAQAYGAGNTTSGSAAMDAYNAGRFEDAKNKWDQTPNDPQARLMAARAQQRQSGCASAIQRYEAVGASGTQAGNDAALELGRCYRQTGNAPLARARLAPLLSVAAYQQQAQQELDAMTPLAVARKVERPSAPAATATTTPAASKPTTTTKADSSY